MPTTVTLSKFVGTISLGLLTGVSYTLSTLALPSLLTLPSAKPAAYTLHQTVRLSTLHIRTLSALATASFALAYGFSDKRVRHPYMLWTGLMAISSAGLDVVMKKRLGKVEKDGDGSGLFKEDEDFNGEQVEKKAREVQWIEFVRTAVSGLGFGMGVVGLWGDGA